MAEAHGRRHEGASTPPQEPSIDRGRVIPPTESREIGPGEQARIVAALRDPSRHGPGCARVDLVETHISYVLLTGTHAYKLKKAIALEFLDFASLASRRFHCDEELRLSRRLAPALSEDVVPITGTPDAPRLGGDGQVLDYAVRMREFPQRMLLSAMLDRQEVDERRIDELAANVAPVPRRHRRGIRGIALRQRGRCARTRPRQRRRAGEGMARTGHRHGARCAAPLHARGVRLDPRQARGTPARRLRARVPRRPGP